MPTGHDPTPAQPGPAGGPPTSFRLQTVGTINELRDSVREFNRGLGNARDCARSLLRQTSYWVYDAGQGVFGPSKFVGYRGMTFPVYEAGRAGATDGASFDGGVTRKAVEHVLGASFSPDDALTRRLIAWGEAALGAGVFDGLDTAKWRFLALP
jgi:hypothetical protein